MDLTTSFKRLIETCDNCQVCLKEWFVNNTEPKVFPIWTNDWANAVSMARAPIELTFLVGQVGLFCHDHVQSLQLGHHASTAPFFLVRIAFSSHIKCLIDLNLLLNCVVADGFTALSNEDPRPKIPIDNLLL